MGKSAVGCLQWASRKKRNERRKMGNFKIDDGNLMMVYEIGFEIENK